MKKSLNLSRGMPVKYLCCNNAGEHQSNLQRTCSSPRFPLRSHYMVCIKNHLFIVGIGPILNTELKFIFRSDRSDSTCVYSYVSVLYDKF